MGGKQGGSATLGRVEAPDDRVLRVGSGRFDALSGELCIDGRAVRLRPRTALLFAHLVRNAGRVVTKDELMQAVWSDVVVTEESVTQCIKEIRQALGASGRDWIRTMPRQGYAFVATADQAPVATPAARAWRWRFGAALVVLWVAAAALAWRLWPATPDPEPSIVVLPIVNLTGDPARELAAEDLTENLATSLARVTEMLVIAPSTAFTFKGKPIDVRRIGSELGARYVLEGSLRVQAGQPVLKVRLAEAASALQLWSEDFPAGDAVDRLEDEVTARVVRSLSLRLARVEAQRSERERPRDPTAADLLTRARAMVRWSAQNAAATAQARELLEEALRRDASLAEAWSLLAGTYCAEVRFSSAPEDLLKRAKEAAARALALAPDSANAHGVQAWVLYNQRRMPQALAQFDRALELSPNDPAMLAGRGAALVMLGRPEEAIAPIEKAMRLSPRDPMVSQWQMFRGVADLHLGRDQAAVEWLRQAIDGNPDNPFTRLFLASALGAAGRLDAARGEMAQFRRLRPGFTLSDFRAREPSDEPAFLRQRERVYAGLRAAGMPG